MISFKEMQGQHALNDIPIAVQQNIQAFLIKMNTVRTAYGQPMVVTSGYRSWADQMRINPHAPNSWHCSGHAVDILDIDGQLKAWILQNVPLLEEVGLWCEDFEHTKTWVHLQDKPPRSGNRFFKP
jgi:uncharacterized protein YcbK (DUF882 family)